MESVKIISKICYTHVHTQSGLVIIEYEEVLLNSVWADFGKCSGQIISALPQKIFDEN